MRFASGLMCIILSDLYPVLISDVIMFFKRAEERMAGITAPIPSAFFQGA